VLYLANPSTPQAREEMSQGVIGCIVTPAQGNRLPGGSLWCADNGCGPGKSGQPGAGYPGDERYLGMLHDWLAEEGADPCDPDQSGCLFAVAPDVVGDAEATLDRADTSKMLGWIRYAGYPVALVAQNGLEYLPVPWDDFDVLFLGGLAECAPCAYVRPFSDREKVKRCPGCHRRLLEWKLGAAARALVAEAKARGKRVHMGRVNSLRRLRYAAAIGCDSADGTYLTRAPDRYLPVIIGWQREVNHNTQAALFDLIAGPA